MRRPDRRNPGLDQRRRLTRPAAAFVCLSVLLAACGQAPPPPATPSPTTAAVVRTSSEPAPTAPVAAPAPPWATDLRGQLECDGVPPPGGHERGAAEPAGHEGTASPYAWLYAIDHPDLPLDRYDFDPVTPWEDGQSHFVRLLYRAGGEVKAVLLMEGTSTQGGPGSWDVTAWQACGPSEFDPADGRTTDDAPLTDATGAETTRVHTIAGPGHCGWQSTVWLRRGHALYLRDPAGVLADESVRPYTEKRRLPASAVDTGLQSVRWRLFTSPDRDVVWMVRPDGGVEAWPRSRHSGLGCA
jgi:hypothetical protein